MSVSLRARRRSAEIDDDNAAVNLVFVAIGIAWRVRPGDLRQLEGRLMLLPAPSEVVFPLANQVDDERR